MGARCKIICKICKNSYFLCQNPPKNQSCDNLRQMRHIQSFCLCFNSTFDIVRIHALSCALKIFEREKKLILLHNIFKFLNFAYTCLGKSEFFLIKIIKIEKRRMLYLLKLPKSTEISENRNNSKSNYCRGFNLSRI